MPTHNQRNDPTSAHWRRLPPTSAPGHHPQPQLDLTLFFLPTHLPPRGVVVGDQSPCRIQ
ncbi:hypothetical protein BC567DRAFT_230835 [Phyllosticta citribraziliensis]